MKKIFIVFKSLPLKQKSPTFLKRGSHTLKNIFLWCDRTVIEFPRKVHNQIKTLLDEILIGLLIKYFF